MLEQIQSRKQNNISEIIVRYLETVLAQFQQAEKRGGEDFALQLTDRELICLKNFHSWLRLFAPQQTKLATKV